MRHGRIICGAVSWWLCCAIVVTAKGADGERIEKYPDGAKKGVYATTPDGERNGPFEEFHPDGKRAAKGTYRKGKLSGPFQSHHPNGKIRIKATYKEGLLAGKLIEHGEAGSVVRQAEYRNDVLHGSYQEFAAGAPVRDEFWVNGELLVPKSAAQIAETLRAIEKAAPKTVGEYPEGSKPWQAALDDARLQAAREAAVKHLQAYRYLCDVPWEDVVLDRTYVAHCEAACDIMNRVQQLTHTPQNPGMPNDEYQFAYKGTNSSNIFSSAAMIDSITAFMDDSDEKNIDRLGHRRWCLNPRMQKTGVAGNHGYSAMWSLDAGRAEPPDYRFVCFPPRGLTPVKLFRSHYAWSCSVNPRHYTAPDPTAVTVSVHPCRFNAKQGTVERTPQALPLNYSRVDRGGFGIPNCIIFRPTDVAVAPGASYWVEIEGLKDEAGKAAPLHYLVSFIGL